MTLINKIYPFRLTGVFTMLLLFCCVANSMAQTGGEVQSETIVIEKNKQLDLPMANREFEKIPDPQPQPVQGNSKYETEEIGIVLPQFDTKVKVPTTKTDEPVDIHNAYVKAGFGNYVTPYFEGFIHTGKKKNYSAGARFKHLSSANGPYKGVQNSLNDLDLQGKYWTKKQWVSLSGRATRERYTWYGYQNVDNLDFDNDSLKNIFNKMQAEFATGNMSSNSKTTYTTRFNYAYQNNNHDNNESDFGVLLDLKHQKDSNNAIIGDVFFDYSSYSDTTTFSRALGGLTAKYRMTREKLTATFGLNYTYSGDTLKGSLGSHVYPLIDLSYSLIPSRLVAVAGLKGGMEKNTWMSFTAQNPYLERNISLANTNNTLNLYVGLRGHIQDKVNFKVGGAYLTYKNLWYVLNSQVDTAKFNIVYDNENASVFNLNGEISYDARPLRTGIKLDYNAYKVGDQVRKPWHRPSFVGTFFASYSIYKKIVLKTDIYYISGISAINLVTNKETNLKDIFDINLKAEYCFSDTFSAFIEVNNLLSSKYQRYMYYQSRGLNMMVGLTYRF